MGSRRKARECALQMLFAADVAKTRGDELIGAYWSELCDVEIDDVGREFATRLTLGTLQNLSELDERIRSRAEHWRISRMAVVDRNIIRMSIYEFLHETDTPKLVIIDEAIEIAKKFGTQKSSQFINGILDGILKRYNLAGT